MTLDASHVQTVSNFLATAKGFNAIPLQNILQLAQEVEILKFDPNDYLIRKGEQGDSMHVIATGRVRIPVIGEDGKLKLSVSLEAGGIVGEMALFTGEPRAADVICDTAVTTYSFRRETVERLLRQHPPLAQFLTEILVKRIEEDRTLQKVGNYRLGRELGKGMTSTVYQATHTTLNRLVAVKMLSHSLVYDEAFLERFLQEARLIAELNHPNIVHVYDLEKSYGTRFIIMEMVDGQSLDRTLVKMGKLTIDQVQAIVRQVASALAYAHARGIAHRDVKPANCIVGRDSTVKLLDFGISRKFGQDENEPAGEKVAAGGTPAYIAPEVIRGQDVDGRADIYSLGCMAYKLLTGRSVFQGGTVEEVLDSHLNRQPPDIRAARSDTPDHLVNFINRTLVKDPDERLSDWDKIFKMLGTADAPLPNEFGAPSDPNSESLLVTYPREISQEVYMILENLREVGLKCAPLDGGAPNLGLPAAGADDGADYEIEDDEATEVDLGLTNALVGVHQTRSLVDN